MKTLRGLQRLYFSSPTTPAAKISNLPSQARGAPPPLPRYSSFHDAKNLPVAPRPAWIPVSKRESGCSCQWTRGGSPLGQACSCALPKTQRLQNPRNRGRYSLSLLALAATILVVYLAVHSFNLEHFTKGKIPSFPHGLIPPATCPLPIPNSSLTFNAPAKEVISPPVYRKSWKSPEDSIAPLEYDVIEPVSPDGKGKGAGWTVVFIHGLGALNASHGWQWRDFMLSESLPAHPSSHVQIGKLDGLRFIFPKAPLRPVTVFDSLPSHGTRPAWFDIKDWRDLNFLEDEDGLRRSCIGISMIISDQMRLGRMRMETTIIAGFSQGAVMAFLLTLSLDQAPSATLMLSGYAPLPFRLPILSAPNDENYDQTSLYWLHGAQDEVLSYNAAKGGFRLLQMLFGRRFNGMKFKSFPGMTHSFSFEEVLVATNWIEAIVDRQSKGKFDQDFDQLLVPENELDDLGG